MHRTLPSYSPWAYESLRRCDARTLPSSSPWAYESLRRCDDPLVMASGRYVAVISSRDGLFFDRHPELLLPRQ